MRPAAVPVLLLMLFVLSNSACTVNNAPIGPEARPRMMRFDEVPSMRGLVSGEVVPPTADESQSALTDAGRSWFFGRGLGKTAINVAGVVVFPPYGLYLLGNAGLELAGVGRVAPTDLLPDGPRKHVEDLYGSVCDVPGRLTSSVAGVEFEEES